MTTLDPLSAAGARARRQTKFGAPVANESERIEFQQRLLVTLRMMLGLSVGVWLVVSVVVLSTRAPLISLILLPESIVLLGISLAVFAIGWLVRGRSRSVAFLDLAAVVSTLLLCFSWEFVTTYRAATGRPELLALFLITCTLAMHAALVPSTALRTTAIALAALLPLIIASYSAWTRNGLASPGKEVVFLALWSSAALACVSTISHVIYGLRLRARNAMQLGQYLLEEKIGEGGMGVVYRARHAMLRRPTAIKLMAGADASSLERFEREVQLTASLRHPNTIVVFDYGRTADDVFYYAMEYLEGISLERLVRDHGRQPPARVVHLLLQVCGALEEAHACGLVHRDVKPANLMLTERADESDVVKVLDFGLVKDASGLHSTKRHTMVGTPHYLAPEAILDPPSVDARSDIYALGVTAYYLLTGRHVFDGSNLVEICSGHIHNEPVPPSALNPAVSRELDEVVLACLAKEREHRPQAAPALARRLKECGLPAWTRADAAKASPRDTLEKVVERASNHAPEVLEIEVTRR